jgi:hypothetical protein
MAFQDDDTSRKIGENRMQRLRVFSPERPWHRHGRVFVGVKVDIGEFRS